MEERESDGATKPAAPSSARSRFIVGLSDGVDRVCTAAFVTTTIAFALMMLVGVFFRYALNDSLAWSDEVGLMIFSWAIFLSIA
ncbi:MAG TPA: TRAP transporter small permease subunit, partial [Candidatus Acidoferrum sp.]|nr:TRAP transporter small permease subunit [Candidatus Acidoferrum sp.]